MAEDSTAAGSSVAHARKQYDLEEPHWEGEAHKFGFKLRLLRTKGALWNKRYFRLFLDRFEYYAKNPRHKGGRPKGAMKFSTTTYAEKVDVLPTAAHEKGFKFIVEGGEPVDFGVPPVDISSHFPVMIAIHNCVYADEKGAVGSRSYIMAWEREQEGLPIVDQLLTTINSWLPCNPAIPGRLPKHLLPHLGQDPKEAQTAVATIESTGTCATNRPCVFTVNSGIPEGCYAHRCRLDIRYCSPEQDAKYLSSVEKAQKGSPAAGDPANAQAGSDPSAAAARDALAALPRPGTAVVHEPLLDNADGSYTSSFVPMKPGVYRIFCQFWGRPCENLGLAIQASGSLIELTGRGWKPGSTSDKRYFGIRITNPSTREPEMGLESNGRLKVLLKRDVGGSMVAGAAADAGEPLPLSVLEDSSYQVCYTASQRGQYQLDLLLDGAHIAGSPHVFHLRPPPASITVHGDGLQTAMTHRVAHFTVKLVDDKGDEVGAGGDWDSGVLQVAVVDPTGAFAELDVEDQHDGTYTVAWQPSVPGPHKVEVKLEGKHAQQPVTVVVDADERYQRDAAVALAKSELEFLDSRIEEFVRGAMMKKFPHKKLGAAGERLIQIKDVEGSADAAYLTWNSARRTTSVTATDRIPLNSIVNVVKGRRTAAGTIFGGYASADEELLFSVLGQDRHIDLQAPSLAARDDWVKAVKLLMRGGVPAAQDRLKSAERALEAFNADVLADE